VSANLKCQLIGSERFIKVDTGAAPNNCVNHKHELNQMVEQCNASMPAMECQNSATTSNHNLLKFSSGANCKLALAYLNKIIVDVTAYASDNGTLQCSSSGYLKDSTSSSKCDLTAAALNRAIGLWQSGSYRACDFTTLTTTATSTIVVTTLTSTASSTVTSSFHGKLSCFGDSGTQYVRSEGRCDDQAALLNVMLAVCDTNLPSDTVGCTTVGGEDVLKLRGAALAARRRQRQST